MNLQKEITELGKSKIQQWRAVMDELEVQLALGKAEAKDLIEREKKTISTYIEKQRAQMNAEDQKVSKKQQALKIMLEDLYKTLEADLAKSKRAYTRNKKEILKSIHLLESNIRENASDYDLWLGENMDELKDSLDDYRIALALGTYESVEEIKNPTQDLRTDLQKSMEKITRLLYPEGNKVSHFINEISDSLEHLKRAFSDLLE